VSQEAAESAGAKYASEQIESDYFADWIHSQMAEARRMREADPSSVIPIETKADYRKLARIMLGDLESDTKRDLDSDVIVDLVNKEVWAEDENADVSREVAVKGFYHGLNEALHEASLINWLACELEAIERRGTKPRGKKP
jgi:hypothetical protein